MPADDRVLRAAEEFQAIAARHGLTRLQDFGDLFEAFEISVSRMFGTSVKQLARQEELRMIREIHRTVVPPRDPDESNEYWYRRMSFCGEMLPRETTGDIENA